ncbi:MAG: winged helix-turn-helix transcriptional regulator [bacterium]|nr:winged helix-turn-helix transcriptional regulator [bacterium]
MPPYAGETRPVEGPREGGWPVARLLRCSHIFASCLREIVEEQLLRQVSPSRLTASQFHVLKLMSRNGLHQVGDVADLLGVSPPAATKNIDKLERLGLVVRTPSPGDRRATLLSVSPTGRRLVQAYDEVAAARLSRATGEFGSEEIELFTGLLERFSVALLGLEPSQRGCCLRCAANIASDCAVGRLRGGCPYHQTHVTESSDGKDEEPSQSNG